MCQFLSGFSAIAYSENIDVADFSMTPTFSVDRYRGLGSCALNSFPHPQPPPLQWDIHYS